MTCPNPTQVLAQINRIEREFVASWGEQGEQQIAELSRRLAAVREAKLPRPGLLRRVFNATAAALLPQQPGE
jgi:hypothetical protein